MSRCQHCNGYGDFMTGEKCPYCAGTGQTAPPATIMREALEWIRDAPPPTDTPRGSYFRCVDMRHIAREALAKVAT